MKVKEMPKEAGAAADRMKREMQRALDRMRVELDRIEILAVALAAFAQPVPDYEPGFRHMRHLTASAIELKRSRQGCT
jgi:hypothetical protein